MSLINSLAQIYQDFLLREGVLALLKVNEADGPAAMARALTAPEAVEGQEDATVQPSQGASGKPPLGKEAATAAVTSFLADRIAAEAKQPGISAASNMLGLGQPAVSGTSVAFDPVLETAVANFLRQGYLRAGGALEGPGLQEILSRLNLPQGGQTLPQAGTPSSQPGAAGETAWKGLAELISATLSPDAEGGRSLKAEPAGKPAGETPLSLKNTGPDVAAEELNDLMDKVMSASGKQGEIASLVILNAAMIPGWPQPKPAEQREPKQTKEVALAAKEQNEKDYADLMSYLASLGVNTALLEKLAGSLKGDAQRGKILLWLLVLLGAAEQILRKVGEEALSVLSSPEDEPPAGDGPGPGGTSPGTARKKRRDRIFLK